MKIIYIGSSGYASYEPLKTLITEGFTVCAIAHDMLSRSQLDNRLSLPLIDTSVDSLDAIALSNDIPVIQFTDNYNNHVAILAAFNADLIVISCYARKLPLMITQLPRLGTINIHPSLLPAYRGPAPLFWQFRTGETNWGVSIHKVTSALDSGAILMQQNVVIEDGVSLQQANEVLTKAACLLLTTALRDFDGLKMAPQDEPNASYQSFPREKDYYLSPQCSARTLFNFICAYATKGRYFTCLINGESFRISQALSYDQTIKPEQPYTVLEDELSLSCSTGLIRCKLDT